MWNVFMCYFEKSTIVQMPQYNGQKASRGTGDFVWPDFGEFSHSSLCIDNNDEVI